MFKDSIDKIVGSYFSAVNAEPFTYKGEHYPVKTTIVSPLLFRGYTCPPNCGGCCPVFSLDYLPKESHPYQLTERVVEFNGKKVKVYSDTQEGRTDHYCSQLVKKNGRCGVHGTHPFSCDFELIRFLHTSDNSTARILTRLYGRGWNFLRVDGERGALCEITPMTRGSMEDAVRKLKRLEQWCQHFKLKNRVGQILEWAKRSPATPLVMKGSE